MTGRREQTPEEKAELARIAQQATDALKEYERTNAHLVSPADAAPMLQALLEERTKRQPEPTLVTDQLDPDDWAHAYFTAYLGEIGRATVSRSLKHARVTRRVYSARMKDDLIFAELHRQANTIWVEAVEHELHDRVLNGLLKPVHHRGEIVGYIREVDNKLLQWYLERLQPEKYHLATKFEQVGDAPTAFKFQMGEAKPELGG